MRIHCNYRQRCEGRTYDKSLILKFIPRCNQIISFRSLNRSRWRKSCFVPFCCPSWLKYRPIRPMDHAKVRIIATTAWSTGHPVNATILALTSAIVASIFKPCATLARFNFTVTPVLLITWERPKIRYKRDSFYPRSFSKEIHVNFFGPQNQL